MRIRCGTRWGHDHRKERTLLLQNIKKIHFVGIGGSGMSGIAKVMLAMGFDVSGSDISKAETIYKLEKLGATIYIGHAAENVADAQAIVLSTAISESNPEVSAARQRGLMVFHRADLLAYIMKSKQGIAVAGAHGKTTTTSMIAVMLEKCGTDPTILIGGELPYLNGNAKLGQGSWVVAEADESDGTFLKLSPQIAVVTNIENDHLDFYKSMDNILFTFKEFLHKLPIETGVAILCFDNQYLRNIAQNVPGRVISYGIDYEADYMARNIRINGSAMIYDVYFHGQMLGTITLDVPGRHNVANSLAAFAVGHYMGLSFEQIAEGLAAFHGVKRRFQTKGKVKNCWIVDDYAHHPTEIMTTLKAARDLNPTRLICIFQPHRYSRTSFLKEEFGRAFLAADHLILTDVYGAGEEPIAGVTGEIIKDEVERQTSQKPIYIADKNKISRYLAEIVEPGDLIMTMGAGDIYQAGEELVERLAKG